MTTLNEYQKQTQEKRGDAADEAFIILGLMGTIGQLAAILSVNIYNQTSPDKGDLEEQLRTIMWYCASMATDLDLTLEEVLSNDD